MKPALKNREALQTYLNGQKDNFEQALLSEAINVKGKIEEILEVGNIDLLNNAHKLVGYIVQGKKQEVIAFAEQEGAAWAIHALTLEFKLEWVQAIRRTLWNFIRQYDEAYNEEMERNAYYELEKQINDMVDQFLNTFFITYSKFKDELIEQQKKLVENLSVPIIPISKSICILPLIGTIDDYRANIIEEKALMAIGENAIQTLIIDLSGIADMEENVIDYILKMIDGATLMGCDPVLTGLRPEIVRKMVRLGVSFGKKALTKGTLQQALQEFMVVIEK